MDLCRWQRMGEKASKIFAPPKTRFAEMMVGPLAAVHVSPHAFIFLFGGFNATQQGGEKNAHLIWRLDQPRRPTSVGFLLETLTLSPADDSIGLDRDRMPDSVQHSATESAAKILAEMIPADGL
jgi:hypothetical protein